MPGPSDPVAWEFGGNGPGTFLGKWESDWVSPHSGVLLRSTPLTARRRPDFQALLRRSRRTHDRLLNVVIRRLQGIGPNSVLPDREGWPRRAWSEYSSSQPRRRGRGNGA